MDYIQVSLPGNELLDDVVDMLQNANKAGKKICVEFNGVMLYSDTVTLDSAYLDVCGCDKLCFDERNKKHMQEIKERIQKWDEEGIKKAPELIERGKKVIYPFRHKDWELEVTKSATGFYNCGDIAAALRIIEVLKPEQPLDEALEIFNSLEDYLPFRTKVRKLVMMYANFGYAFYKVTSPTRLFTHEYEWIEGIMDENSNHFGLPFHFGDIEEEKVR